MGVAEVPTLILCFPAMGLLLFALGVIEERLPGPPGKRPPGEAGREKGLGPAERGVLVRWPAGRAPGKQSSGTEAPAADRQYRQAG